MTILGERFDTIILSGGARERHHLDWRELEKVPGARFGLEATARFSFLESEGRRQILFFFLFFSIF